MDDFIIQHPLGGGIAQAGVGPKEARCVVEPELEGRTSVPGSCHNPCASPCQNICHRLIYEKEETEEEGPHEGKREADRERQHQASNSAFSLVETAQ